MKLNCSGIVIFLLILLGFGGGFAVGKATQPITINNISKSKSISEANSYAIAGNINVINSKHVKGSLIIKLKGITNIKVYNISNNITNILTNNVAMTNE